MEVTQEQLDQATRETGVECFVLTVPLDDNGTNFTEGIVKKPSLPAISAYLTMVDRDPIQAHQMLLANCLLTQYSDAKLLTDPDLILGSLAAMQSLIRARRGELKKKVNSGGLTQATQEISTERPV